MLGYLSTAGLKRSVLASPWPLHALGVARNTGSRPIQRKDARTPTASELRERDERNSEPGVCVSALEMNLYAESASEGRGLGRYGAFPRNSSSFRRLGIAATSCAYRGLSGRT